MPGTPQISDALTALIDDLAGDLKELVTEIEASPKTTQNHYGRYMSVIAESAQGDRAAGRVIAMALIKAGANQPGVSSAFSLSF